MQPIKRNISYILLLVALWQPASCLRIQDGLGVDENVQPDVAVGADKGNIQGYPVSLMAADPSQNSTDGNISATPSPWSQHDIILTLKIFLSGYIDLSSIDNLALNLGFEYVETLHAPPTLLKLLKGSVGNILRRVLEKTVRVRLYGVQKKINIALAELKTRIRETLVDIDSPVVNALASQSMREAVAETGIELIGKARIGFQRNEDSFGAVVEIPWTKEETSKKMCAGASGFGAVTLLAFLPFAIIAGCAVCCTFRKTALGFLLAGAAFATPWSLRPLCDSSSMAMFSVPPIRREINMSETAVELGLPPVFGINTSWDEDAFRVYADFLNETELKTW